MYIFPFGDQYSKVEKEIIFVASYNAAYKFCICPELTCFANILYLSPVSFFYILLQLFVYDFTAIQEDP